MINGFRYQHTISSFSLSCWHTMPVDNYTSHVSFGTEHDVIFKSNESSPLKSNLFYRYRTDNFKWDKLFQHRFITFNVNLLSFIPKLVMLTLRGHCEHLNSSWSEKCGYVVEFLFFSYNRLCTVASGIRFLFS